MQGKEQEDDLVDYNEDPDYAGTSSTTQHTSHSPAQTPTSLKSDESEGEEGDEDSNDLEEGQEIEMDSSSTQQSLVKQRQKEFDTLASKLEENGWKLRLKVFEDPLQSNRAMSMTTPTSTRTLAEILQLVPLEDAEQISEFQGTVYVPLFFLEKYRLPTMQMRKIIEPEEVTTSGSEPLPGGSETAILYSL
jgi:hypothetical protein